MELQLSTPAKKSLYMLLLLWSGHNFANVSLVSLELRCYDIVPEELPNIPVLLSFAGETHHVEVTSPVPRSTDASQGKCPRSRSFPPTSSCGMDAQSHLRGLSQPPSHRSTSTFSC